MWVILGIFEILRVRMSECANRAGTLVFTRSQGWYWGRDLNPYSLRNQILNLARLPISPPQRVFVDPFGRHTETITRTKPASASDPFTNFYRRVFFDGAGFGRAVTFSSSGFPQGR
jgi:hypothetical protein